MIRMQRGCAPRVVEADTRGVRRLGSQSFTQLPPPVPPGQPSSSLRGHTMGIRWPHVTYHGQPESSDRVSSTAQARCRRIASYLPQQH